jgi:hypothetical protein
MMPKVDKTSLKCLRLLGIRKGWRKGGFGRMMRGRNIPREICCWRPTPIHFRTRDFFCLAIAAARR